MIGLRIDYWARQVGRLWTNGETEREKRLSALISQQSLKDKTGRVITSLDELKSAASTTKACLNAQARDLDDRGEKLFQRHTAGTSGEPTQIRLNRDELGRMLAVREYCFNYWGISIGDREARLWGRQEPGWRPKLKNFLMHRKVFHPVGEQGSAEARRLIDWQPAYIYGYSSLILELARIFQKEQLTPPPIKVVICTAETILPSQKRFISDVFKAPVVEEYGSTEFDIIAFECREGHRHFVNPWLWVESQGGQTLLTDISRSSQCLKRYDLADSLVVSNDPRCELLGAQCWIRSLEGRNIDQLAYDKSGKKFHGVAFSHAANAYMEQENEVLCFSVQQHIPGMFEVSTTSEPRLGHEHFISFIRDRVRESEEVDIDVVRADIESTTGAPRKKSYFSQYLEMN